jgi:ribosomal protein S18 acetylase RimI-like enzyme
MQKQRMCKGGMKLFEIRHLKENEKSFLMEMLYESIHIEEEKKPPIDALLNTYELKKYHQNWGRKGDKALIAVDYSGIPVGAVWYRLFGSEERGYGYVNDDTPELGIAIKKDARGKGLGTKLMHSIIEEAKVNNHKSLSLSVDVDNTQAINLYRRLGFVEVGKVGSSNTMLLNG